MNEITCPCCFGTGRIEEQSPVPLTPLQFLIYDKVRRSKYGITGSDLVKSIYEDRIDGGPEWAQASMATTIFRLNVRLKLVGQRVRSGNGGNRSYKLEKF